MYAKTAFISAFTALAAAASAPAPAPHATQNPNIFAAISLHSTSKVQGNGINANGQAFYNGKGISTYCPEGIQGLDCSKTGNATVFTYNPAGQTLSMNVEVPGGQLVYVATDGALGFTRAHSSAIPEGTVYEPFEYAPQEEEGRVGILTFNGKSFNSCPVEGQENVYQIHASGVEGFGKTDCIDIAFSTTEWDGPAAWEHA